MAEIGSLVTTSSNFSLTISWPQANISQQNNSRSGQLLIMVVKFCLTLGIPIVHNCWVDYVWKTIVYTIICIHLTRIREGHIEGFSFAKLSLGLGQEVVVCPDIMGELMFFFQMGM